MEAKSLLGLARQDTDNLTRLEAATKKAVDAGGRPMVEFNRVRLDLLKSQQDLREAESALAIAKAKLRAQFGRTDRDPAFDVDGNLDSPLTAEPLRWRRRCGGPAEPSRYPVLARAGFQGRGGYGRRAAEGATADHAAIRLRAASIRSPSVRRTSIPGTLRSPPLCLLFDRNQGGRAKAQSVAAQNCYNLQAGLVDLRAEIEEAVQNFSTAYQKAGSVAQEQVRLAAEVRDSIAKAYDAGGRPLIDVLDAQRTYRETYRLYISSRADYWRSLYKYNSAIGKQVTR